MNAFRALGVFLLISIAVDASLLDPVIENVRHIKATHPPENVPGMWKKKMLWKPRWVKEWKPSNVLKPIWKKFWGPVIIREWVPIPKPPPTWDTTSSGHSIGSETKPVLPGVPFIKIGEPPLPNFSYLPKPPASAGYTYNPPKQPFSVLDTSKATSFAGASGNYQAPHLPISTGFNSQAESYMGQSSYGSTKDSGGYDLNPPVEQYNPQFADYGHSTAASNLATYVQSQPPKQVHPHTHAHHHHHHHHHHHAKPTTHNHIHSQSLDLTKFPPDWSSWKPLQPYRQTQQESLAVSVVSKLQSTTPAPHNGVAGLALSGVQSANNELIQQAALVGEYHYSEPDPRNPSSASVHSSFPHHSLPGDSGVGVEPASTRPPLHRSVPTPAPAHNQVAPPPQKPTSIPVPPHKPLPTSSAVIPPHKPAQAIPERKPVQAPVLVSHKPAPAHVPFDKKRAQPHSFPLQKPDQASSTVVLHQKTVPPTPVAPPHKQVPVPPPVAPPHRTATPPPRKPHSSPSNSHFQNAIPPQKYPTKPIHTKEQIMTPNRTRTEQLEIIRIPDFKALPSSSVETFHYIEAFPSNQTITQAALIGNVDETGFDHNSSQVSIVTPASHKKRVSPHVAKLAQAVIQEHIKRTNQKTTPSPTTPITTTTTTTSTEKAAATVVLPTTSSSIKKTLKAYLADEAIAATSTNVFIVTPVPHNKSES